MKLRIQSLNSRIRILKSRIDIPETNTVTYTRTDKNKKTNLPELQTLQDMISDDPDGCKVFGLQTISLGSKSFCFQSFLEIWCRVKWSKLKISYFAAKGDLSAHLRSLRWVFIFNPFWKLNGVKKTQNSIFCYKRWFDSSLSTWEVFDERTVMTAPP